MPALIEYATICAYQGDIKKSEKYFLHCLKTDPQNVQANLRLGKVYQEKINDPDQAKECYEKVIEFDSQNSQAHYKLGTVYLQKNNYKRATECFKEALKVIKKIIIKNI